MKTLLKTFFFPMAVTFLTMFFIENYVPLKYFSFPRPQKLGTSITTINGTDRITDSRTVINTNFSNLNSGKLETSVTTLPLVTTLANLATVGTITSGVWNGTAVTVPFGGTGAATFTTNQLLLGQGASAFIPLGSYGNSGQLLTSGGNGVAPSWTSSSFDQTQNYSLSGLWSWSKITVHTATTTFGQGFVASSTTFTYATSTANTFSFVQNRATTSSPFNKKLQTFTTNVSITAPATSTVVSLSIPAFALGTSTVVTGKLYFHNASSTLVNGDSLGFCMAYGGIGMGCVGYNNNTGGNVIGLSGALEYTLYGAGTTNSQESALLLTAGGYNSTADGLAQTTMSYGVADVDDTQEKVLTITARVNQNSFTVINGWTDIKQ